MQDLYCLELYNVSEIICLVGMFVKLKGMEALEIC